ncbi:MAG: HAMP domain-containing protein [Candidatus Latescibacterota bacterium]|nr:MAG: HAMP domain-containing protein [Candidatus Latescibacterota bacterium]
MRTELAEGRSTQAESPATQTSREPRQAEPAGDAQPKGSWLQRALRRRHYWINSRSQLPATGLAVLATLFFVVMFNWAMFERTSVRREIIAEIRPLVENRLRDQDQAFHGFLLVLSAGFIVCLTVGMVIFTHRSAGPVHRVRLHMRRVVEGDLNHRVTLRRKDNFKELAVDFNAMLHALQDRNERECETLEGLALRLCQPAAQTQEIADTLRRLAHEKDPTNAG